MVLGQLGIPPLHYIPTLFWCSMNHFRPVYIYLTGFKFVNYVIEFVENLGAISRLRGIDAIFHVLRCLTHKFLYQNIA